MQWVKVWNRREIYVICAQATKFRLNFTKHLQIKAVCVILYDALTSDCGAVLPYFNAPIKTVEGRMAMDTPTIVLCIIYLILSVAIIGVVLFQQAKSQQLGEITGGAETFFGKGKSRRIDVILKRLTVIGLVLFFVLTLIINFVLPKI